MSSRLYMYAIRHLPSGTYLPDNKVELYNIEFLPAAECPPRLYADEAKAKGSLTRYRGYNKLFGDDLDQHAVVRVTITLP